MKKSTKLIASAIIAIAVFAGSNAKAQMVSANKVRFGIGVEGGVATGNAHNISNLELGGTGRIQYGLTNNLALTLTSGYYNFFGKNDALLGVKYQSLGIVPVKLGIKAFFAPNLYFGAEAGAGFETKAFGLVKGENNADFQKNTKLILSPAIGYASKSWDVGVRYENFSGQNNSYGLVALRVAYGFGL